LRHVAEDLDKLDAQIRASQERIKKDRWSRHMRLTPPRPPGEDYFLACASFSSKAPVDGFWTYSKCFTGSWLAKALVPKTQRQPDDQIPEIAPV
jgi:hypothetical protein